MTIKTKYLHGMTENKIRILTRLNYNTNTNHITIGNIFIQRKYEYKIRPTNKESSTYLGVTIAEKVLSKIFKNVERMPYGNRGFDFICGKGFKVDVKSSCKYKYNNNRSDNWIFHIGKNKTADYFLCLAFDNRELLNPEHLWLIPQKIINNKSISISKSTINKWNEYKQDISKIIKCCDNIKGDD